MYHPYLIASFSASLDLVQSYSTSTSPITVVFSAIPRRRSDLHFEMLISSTTTFVVVLASQSYSHLDSTYITKTETMSFDPFEARMQFLQLLRKLNASQQSIQKVVGYAIKYGSKCGEDLWECILEECAKVPTSVSYSIPNARRGRICEADYGQRAPSIHGSTYCTSSIPSSRLLCPYLSPMPLILH